MRKLRVALTQRGSLADVLRGHCGLHMDAVEVDEQNPDIKLRKNEVGVGYLDSNPDPLPHFLVVPAAERRDFFAWVNTYCSFVTPLSQWCRIVSENEFRDLRTLTIVPTYGERNPLGLEPSLVKRFFTSEQELKFPRYRSLPYNLAPHSSLQELPVFGILPTFVLRL